MPSSNADFQARWKQEVVLPSGLTVDIRKIQAWDFIGLGDLPLPVATPEATEPGEVSLARIMMLREYTQRAIAKGVIAPKMTDVEEKHGSDLFYVGYLEKADAEMLAVAILQWGGLTEDTARAVDTFRVDPVSTVDQGDGGAVSRPALDAAEVLAR